MPFTQLVSVVPDKQDVETREVEFVRVRNAASPSPLESQIDFEALEIKVNEVFVGQIPSSSVVRPNTGGEPPLEEHG